jgi:hypothetical protein
LLPLLCFFADNSIVNAVEAPPAESFDKDFNFVGRTGAACFKVKTSGNENTAESSAKLTALVGETHLKIQEADNKSAEVRAKARLMEAKAQVMEAKAQVIKYAATANLIATTLQSAAVLAAPIALIGLAK